MNGPSTGISLTSLCDVESPEPQEYKVWPDNQALPKGDNAKEKTRHNHMLIHGEERRDVMTSTRGTLIRAVGCHCLPEGSNPRSDSTDQNAISPCITEELFDQFTGRIA
jgi:hypothetical protein